MARFDPIYTNFSAGEFSPLLSGRIDLQKYRSGCEIMENYMPRPHGPSVRRGGLRYLAETKDMSKEARLIPFDTGSETGLYHLELGDLYMRFFTEDGVLEVTPGTPYEITTPYTEAQLFELYYVQNANTLFILHKDHHPKQLERLDTYNWTLTDVAFVNPPTEWAANNYPSCGAFYEQRFILGGTPNEPATLWGSTIGKYFDFTGLGTSLNDEDPFEYTIYTDRLNAITWMSSGEVMAIGTTGGEYKMMSTAFNEAITPTNVKIVRQTNYGVAAIAPIRMGNRVLFVQKGKLKVRNFAYRLDSDSFTSEDLTLLSEHITFPTIIESEYSNEPDSIAWYVRGDGELVGVAYEPEVDITGWFRIVTNGVIESISVTDGWSDTRYDDIYVIVNRWIDGGQKRYVEKLERPFNRGDSIEDAFYVDSGLTYTGVATDTVSGLDHLEGETVQILADGATHPDRVVSSGSVTLQREAEKIHVGLGYDSTLKTMRVEGGNPIGTAQGKTKRVHSTDIRLYNTVGIVVNGERFFFGPPVMNEPVQPYSGDISITLDVGYETAGQIEIVQNQPLPSTIVAVMPGIRTT